MILLLDTSVLIDHLRGDERAAGRLLTAAEQGHEIWSVAVVRTEIYAGAFPSEEADIRELFARLRWIDVTPDLADAAGRLGANYRRSHPGIDAIDFIVGAAALEVGAKLMTMNVKHFPMFPGLRPAY